MTESIETPTGITPEIHSWLQRLPPFAERPPGFWRAQRLPSITNRTYLMRSGELAMVLRLPHIDAPTAIDRIAEMHNLGLAAALGLAPPVKYMDPRSGVLVTEFLDASRPLAAKDFALPETQLRVGEFLRALQSSRAPFHGRQEPITAIDRYLAKHEDRQAASLRRELAPLLEGLQSSVGDLVPAHIDLHASNILRREDGSLIAIDWEFSALADPHWDVAAVLNAMPEDDAAIRNVMRAALPDGGEVEAERVRAYQIALYLVAGSWCAMEAAARDDTTLEKEARRYLERCALSIASGHADKWLGLAGF